MPEEIPTATDHGLSPERYGAIVTEAYDRVNTEGFNAVNYVKGQLLEFQKTDSSPSSRVLIQVEVSETLGNAINHVDSLESVNAYEQLKNDLQTMTPEERALARSSIKVAETMIHSMPGKENFGSADSTAAQLMTILA